MEYQFFVLKFAESENVSPICLYGCNIYNDGSTKSTKIWICEIDKGNPKYTKLVHVRNFFFTFLSLRFFDIRRERYCYLAIYTNMAMSEMDI